MKFRYLLVFVLALALLAFPAVGHASGYYEISADESLEEVERISDTRSVRLHPHLKSNNPISFPKVFSLWNGEGLIQEEKPFTVSKKFLVLRVLRL